MCSDKKVIKVRIYGAEYTIRGAADEKYIKNVAEYVNQKMMEIDRNTRIDSSLKVAILASLNITDELLKLKEENEKIRTELKDKIEQINRLIDRKILSKS
ncbi:cell division protein ZapA [candidate division KSB1 bacterium]|nr:MAG: cell division protein ZapA [candidate division KSB1 bacterium]